MSNRDLLAFALTALVLHPFVPYWHLMVLDVLDLVVSLVLAVPADVWLLSLELLAIGAVLYVVRYPAPALLRRCFKI